MVFTGLVHAIWHWWKFDYLPQPFFYGPIDVWGDWFNVVYWSYDFGTYDAYRTVYPPLSFVITNIFSLRHCYPIYAVAGNPSVGIFARNCDWVGYFAFNGVYIICIILLAKTYFRDNPATSIARSYALAASFPMLQAMEHANLIVWTFLGFMLAFGNVVRSSRWRWFWAGFAFNLKIYVIAAILPQLLRRRWLWVEGALISCVVIYIASYVYLGRGTPMELYANITDFANGATYSFLDIWFPSTNAALISLANNWQSELSGLIGSQNNERILFWLPLFQHVTQAAIILAAVGVWLRPEAVTRHRLTFLGISLALITAEAGGYTVILIFFCVFFEPWKGFARKYAIVMTYILCLPWDIPIDRAPEYIADTWFPANTVIMQFYIMIGPFIRPTLLLTIVLALSLLTISEVWTDIRAQGWRTRFRFRHDLPLLNGVGAIVAPNMVGRQ